ncbi:hypothetical protein CERSUDRAFT_75015 [Gelatoporia subvermispora B]|uniref:Uncharacterized protein n=1 Tax=Ceriporiopsis subvermispora (strain B) TaxID=914234 RepID=M2QEF5_CERS8|nr:hypothetical protein CERSUDRAFT_75015 [Gelatoporia subvermispora B]
MAEVVAARFGVLGLKLFKRAPYRALRHKVSIRVAESTGSAAANKETHYPPEILHAILLQATLRYVGELYADALETENPDFQNLKQNLVSALLQVSHQWRETTFVVLSDTLGAERNPDGTLPDGYWSRLKGVRQALHISHTGDRATFDAFLSGLSSLEHYGLIPQAYIALSRLDLCLREWATHPWDSVDSIIKLGDVAISMTNLVKVHTAAMRQSTLCEWMAAEFHLYLLSRTLGKSC